VLVPSPVEELEKRTAALAEAAGEQAIAGVLVPVAVFVEAVHGDG